MFTKTLLLSASLAALALADPIPQAAATTENLATLSSELAALSSGIIPGLPSIYSDFPTLPSSIESVLATAIPTSVIETQTDPCAFVTDAPQWYNSLPASVKSALTSYDEAVASWQKEHSAALASMNSGYSISTGNLPALVCTNTGAAVVGGKTTSSGAAKNTATATGAGAGSTGTGSGVGSSSSKAAAPRATGAVAAGLGGVVGLLGLMAAL